MVRAIDVLDRAAVPFDNLPADPQPEPRSCSRRLCRVEGFEEMHPGRLGYSGAAVGDSDLDRLALIGDVELDPLFRRRFKRVLGVLQQVEDHLGDLGGLAVELEIRRQDPNAKSDLSEVKTLLNDERGVLDEV